MRQHFQNITKFIGERLSPTKLGQYMELMKLFRSRLIEGDKLIRCLLYLFREDEVLSKMFNKLMETEIREMRMNGGVEPIAEIEETIEEHRLRRRRIHVRFRCKIGRNEADLPIKKRSKYRSGLSVPVGPHEYKSEINKNCGEVS